MWFQQGAILLLPGTWPPDPAQLQRDERSLLCRGGRDGPRSFNRFGPERRFLFLSLKTTKYHSLCLCL